MEYSYRDRRKKKGNFRALWIQRINAAARQYDMSYSEFMGKVNKKGIVLNRKVLADLAMNHPEAFEAVVNEIKDIKGHSFTNLPRETLRSRSNKVAVSQG